jgi:hypothetical protein
MGLEELVEQSVVRRPLRRGNKRPIFGTSPTLKSMLIFVIFTQLQKKRYRIICVRLMRTYINHYKFQEKKWFICS